MAAPTRPGKPGAAPAAVDNRVSFGEDAFYTAGGGGIPEGRYCLYFDAVVHQYQKTDGSVAGPEFLAIRVAAYALDAPQEEPKLGYYSMGRKAILSFMPNVDDEGKSLLPIPGGPATTVNESTNWNIFRKSLIDSGMPQGVFTNDLRSIDGVWVHITNIPEPEERKGFGAATGEAQQERKNQTIAVVSEILDGGAPWEGGGGLPEAPVPTPAVAAPAPGPKRIAPKPAAAAPVATATVKAPARTAPKIAPKAAAPAPAPVETESAAADDDVLAAAQNAVASVLEGSPDGIAKLVLKTGVFKAASKQATGEMAQAILDTYFVDEDTMNALLGTLGYVVNGPRVVPV